MPGVEETAAKRPDDHGVERDHRLSVSAVEIRDVRGVEELRACQALQRRAWGITEDGYVMPTATMAAVQKVGGLVLGAFVGERLAGFSFAFLGRVHGDLVLYSQLAAVDPELHSRGLGYKLKLEQRRRAAEVGLARVVWAFDPLQASNSYFNLARLGAFSQTYEVNLYGTRTDALNAGLESDRLMAEWPTSGPVGGRRERWPTGLNLLASVPLPHGSLRRPLDPPATLPDAQHLHVETPADIAAVKRADPALARAWQLAVRSALQQAFAAGYRAVGFSRGEPPCFLLERTS